jgi:hypothetical protein
MDVASKAEMVIDDTMGVGGFKDGALGARGPGRVVA